MCSEAILREEMLSCYLVLGLIFIKSVSSARLLVLLALATLVIRCRLLNCVLWNLCGTWKLRCCSVVTALVGIIMLQKTFGKVLFELKVEANRRKGKRRELASCILVWHSNMLRVKRSFCEGYHSFMHYHSPVSQEIPALCVPVTNNAIWQMFTGSFKEGSGHVWNSSHHKEKLRVLMLLLQLKHAQIRMHIALHMFFMHAYCPMIPVNESKKK